MLYFNKSKFKKFVKFSLVSVSFLLLSACSGGLGEEVDLEAPVLKITSHVNMQYVPLNFTISGTCSDNTAVKTVEVRNTQTKELLGNGSVSGETWSFTHTVDSDQELPLTFTAIDKNGNSGESSIGQITVVVDAQDPVLKTCYIKRSGKYLVNYTAKENLLSYVQNKNDTGSKDYLQNESIIVEGSVSDNYKAEKVLLSILDDEGNVILSEIPSNDGTTAYTPAFTITQKMLTDAKSELATGEHYLHAKVDVYDGAGNKESTEYQKGFCWLAESDLPNVAFSLAANNLITVSKETPIPVNIFDDDGIAEIYSKIVPKTEWASIYDENAKTFSLDGFHKKDADGSRDSSVTEKAASESGEFVFAVAVLDKKNDNSEGVWNYQWCDVSVNAEVVPIILVKSPSENSSPELTDSKFTLSAYALDYDHISNAAFAWIPNGLGEAEGVEKAKNLLSAIAFANFTSETDESGIKYEKFDVKKIETPVKFGEKNEYKKSTFSKEFDVTEYFSYNGQIENAVKTFVLYVRNKEGAGVYKIFRLGSYSDSPSVNIKNGESEIKDLTTNITLGTTFNLKVSAKGYNGLKLKSLTGSYITDEANAEPVLLSDLIADSENSVSLKIEKPNRYTLTVEAEDIFGNKAKSSKTFIPGESVTLSRFTSGMKKGIYLTQGETLTMQAEFTGSVTGMSGTKIELTNIKGVTGTQYAVCSSELESDSIVYTYTVPDGAYTESGVAVSSGTKILNSDKTELYVLPDEAQVLGKNAEIYVDAVAPSIVSYSPDQNKVIGDDKKITITFDDNIYLESGTITVERTTGWAIPPVLTADEFTEIYATLSDEDKKNFIGSADGNPVLTPNSAQPVGPYKKVTHGVKEFTGEPVKDSDGDPIYVDNTGDAVPDASTKYVLAFDYDIFETDGDVEKIRKALEGYGYHKKDYDVSDSAVSVSGKKLTITLDDDVLVDGREFTVTIPAGCVRDEAGNVNKELARDTYKFWSQKTAKPVIRTDRYTHGADAPEPYLDGGEIKIRTIGKEDITSAPTGQIRVRIDCETPHASISYGIQSNKSEKGVSDLAATQSSKVANMTMSDFEKLTCNQNYSKVFLAGESDWNYAEKNYIRAVATKSASGSEPALSESDSGLEMATKTVLYYSTPQGNHSKDESKSAKVLYFQGSDSIGEPVASAFPMRDANPDMRWSRYAYKTNIDAVYASQSDWVCVSWDIITSGWRLQSITKNWQNPETKNLDYGILYYNKSQGYYKAPGED